MARKFYKTTFVVEVLSEDAPLDVFSSLAEVGYQISEGACVGDISGASEEISAKKTAELCLDFHSDPGFFQLDDEGRELEPA